MKSTRIIALIISMLLFACNDSGTGSSLVDESIVSSSDELSSSSSTDEPLSSSSKKLTVSSSSQFNPFDSTEVPKTEDGCCEGNGTTQYALSGIETRKVLSGSVEQPYLDSFTFMGKTYGESDGVIHRLFASDSYVNNVPGVAYTVLLSAPEIGYDSIKVRYIHTYITNLDIIGGVLVQEGDNIKCDYQSPNKDGVFTPDSKTGCKVTSTFSNIGTCNDENMRGADINVTIDMYDTSIPWTGGTFTGLESISFKFYHKNAVRSLSDSGVNICTKESDVSEP